MELQTSVFEEFHSYKELKQAVTEYIDYYNEL